MTAFLMCYSVLHTRSFRKSIAISISLSLLILSLQYGENPGGDVVAKNPGECKLRMRTRPLGEDEALQNDRLLFAQGFEGDLGLGAVLRGGRGDHRDNLTADF